MCGIVGYLGERDIKEVILVALERLEYRGYDSCGLAVREEGKLEVVKTTGRLPKLKAILAGKRLEGNIGIGHTRWATHGPVEEKNAHPLTDCQEAIAVVHNGIIENYQELKEELVAEGHIFKSDTDSEVICHLLEKYAQEGPLTAFQKTTKRLKGTYAILAIFKNEPYILGAKLGSPLLVGFSKKDKIIASDILALVGVSQDVFVLDDFEICLLGKKRISFFNFEGARIRKRPRKIDISPKAVTKGRYRHYMRKEIFEQPAVLEENIRRRILPDGRLIFDPETRILPEEIKNLERILIFACGTSYHAGLIARDYFETFAKIPTQVEIASELIGREIVFKDKERILGISISQSGETIDTLFALRMLKSKGIKVLSVVNTKRSSIDRESDASIYINCGPEIGVASTKAYTAQLFTLLLFSIYCGEKREVLDNKRFNGFASLKEIPAKMNKVLKLDNKIKEIARMNFYRKDFIFLGRGINYPQALEGALKLKEISYIHATGYPAGEMKHGPISLLGPDVGVVAMVLRDALYEKMLSNLNEVKSRGGKIITIAEEGDVRIKELADYIVYVPPTEDFLSPLITIIPLQLLAYHIAVLRGCDVDKPRHLAKSVVVE